MSFKKGTSGNPGGRLKGVERLVREELNRLAKDAGYEDGLAALVRRVWFIAMTGESREALTAVQVLLDRGFGKPKQEVDVTIGSDAPAETAQDPIADLDERGVAALQVVLEQIDRGSLSDAETPTEH